MATLEATDHNDTLNNNNSNNESKTLIKSKKYKVPDYVNEMNVQDKLANQKIIKDMNKRINFLRNPRFRVNKAPILFRTLDHKPELETNVNNIDCPFRANPEIVLFQDYMINQVYQIPLTITNVQNLSRRFKFLPPSTEQFTVTNVKFPIAPPRSEYEETITSEFGLIAPGMSVTLDVTFHSTSFAEFEDKITVICDDNIFHIPIMAKKESPSINLPELLDCQSCWLGDKAEMVFRIKNKGGEGGFKFFCENEEDDQKQQEGDSLKLQNFSIFPAEFFIEKNKEMEVYVTYYPKKSGVCTEKVILACDNQTSAVYTLQGKANTAELEIFGIDGKPYNANVNEDDYDSNMSEQDNNKKKDGTNLGEVQKVFFEGAVPNQEVSRGLQIKNKTQVRVKYHWSLFKNDRKNKQFSVDNEEDFAFKIIPESGYFEPEQIVDFQIQYKSDNYIPIFEYASLFIDDIPYSSIKNPPESLKKQLEEEMQAIEMGRNQQMGMQGGSIPQPAYFGINSTRPSISYFEYELIGLSDYCQVEIDPSFYLFPDPLYQGKVYTRTFKIKNISKCKIQYKIKEFKVSSWEVTSFLPETEGSIDSFEEKEIEVGFSSSKIGQNQKISFLVDFDFTHSKSIELVGDFVGSKIRILEPEINFGLFKSFTTCTKTITIENTSEIDAEVAFYLESEKDSEKLEIKSNNNGEEEDEDDYIWENAYNKDIELHKKAKVKFFPRSILLSPGEKNTVQVLCEAENSYTHKDIARIEVKEGKTQYMNIFAEIQDIHVSLNRYSFDFECLFAGNVYSFEKQKDEQYLEIQNLGNLPAKFQWNLIDNDKYQVVFQPDSGEIPPKSYFPIKFTLKPKQGGKFDNIFICDILENPEEPLGFEINTNILGLSVEYEQLEYLAQPASNTSLAIDKKVPGSSKFKSTFLQKTIQKQQQQNLEGTSQTHTNNNNNNQTKSIQSTTKENNKKFTTKDLNKIDFYGCQINQPKSINILIKNTSGIDTKFQIYPEKYLPFLDSNHVSTEDSLNQTQMSQGSQRSLGNNTSVGTHKSYRKGHKSIRPVKPTTLITAEIEKKNNFTSVQGQQLNAAKKLEKDQRQYLSNNLGIALLCEPSKGSLPAYGEAIINVSCFNDICGLFDDKLCCEIKGLPIKKYDVDIEVKGTPVVIKPNQLGITYSGDFPLFHLGSYMKNCQTVTREFRIQNTGPKTIELEWKIYNLDEDEEGGEKNFFDIEIGPPSLGSKNVATLNFNPIEPEEAKHGPFTMDTNKYLLEGRNQQNFKIQFKTDQARSFNAVIIAKPRLIDNPEVKVGDLALYLKAETMTANLHLEKYLTVEGTHKLKFERWALSQNKKETKVFALINQKTSNLIFKIELYGPFKFVSTGTNSPAKYELANRSIMNSSQEYFNNINSSSRPQSGNKQLPKLNQKKNSLKQLEEPIQTTFNLVPNSNIEIKLALEGPDIKDYEHWPMTEKVYKFGGLNFYFSNGDEQNIELEGMLLRPAISLNTVGHEGFDGKEEQDFGTVHINNKKTISVFLSNRSKVPAHWKLNNIKIKSYKNISDLTQTIAEKENVDKTDDPDVFEFSVSSGVLYGPSVPVKSMPDTSALPGVKTNQDISRDNLFPQQILINFRPKRNILYKSKFRITVDEGPNVDLVLKGFGTYEEHLEI